VKQVLILQDLGIPHKDFSELISKYILPYAFINKIQSINDSESIEGIITIKTKVTEELLKELPNIKFIAVAFTGFDCVDLEAAKKRKIAVFNVPTYATDCTAELAVGLAISLVREIPKSDQITKTGGWELKPGFEFSGKNIGIIGTGKIGVRAAEIFKAFHCNIIGWSKSENEDFTKLGGEYREKLEDLFSEADIISIHLPLNDSTNGLINMSLLSQMKKTAYLINVARGPVVNTEDLAQILNEERISGAGIDVYDQEPILPDNPLLKSPNTILTPHIAYKTVESLLRRADITFQNIRNFVDGRPSNLIS
jgi:lactate dehydrogenase-like 2-hydroxyacid dehydrogenase